jgi:hypothetical protein
MPPAKKPKTSEQKASLKRKPKKFSAKVVSKAEKNAPNIAKFKFKSLDPLAKKERKKERKAIGSQIKTQRYLKLLNKGRKKLQEHIKRKKSGEAFLRTEITPPLFLDSEDEQSQTPPNDEAFMANPRRIRPSFYNLSRFGL